MVSNLKNFAKQTINKKNMKTMGWDEIFENHISDKGLISKTYKELIQLNSKNNKKHITIKNGQERDFSGGPVAKTPCSQCRGLGLDSQCEGQGTRSSMLQLRPGAAK